ncbi:differentially expressed in FDCP 6 homolog isoform X1 [Varroa jacobsoni]|nr:differentially expressed in FDCP 6 homolog isoform X1 [Varroa jacobsoni]XP_022703200.1 differentially expressed in FDCP 6 homolog isoform X1 [Varroa jacobsoni]XP_022703201.1 differentially expressed in FDCP 6 homolog isoform X1 [Varroa jacobsoni]XP_022703202.1 differentially expressed in FDCP 6 homolog isoform X1 [Varroa jacobsoni]
MTSLSSDVTNAVWYAYRHHERLKGCVPRNDLITLTSRIGHVVGAPLVAHSLTLQQTPLLHFGQLMCFLEKELFAPFQASCDIKLMQRSRDQIEEVCWQECSQSLLSSSSRLSPVLPERAVYHLFRVFCFLAELKSDEHGKVHVLLSPEEAEELSHSFVQALGERWKPSEILALLPQTPLDFSALLNFVETHLAQEQDPRGLAEAAAEMFDIYIGDVIKKGPVKRKHFTIWWEYVLVVRPHFLQFYNGKGKRVSEFQLTSRSQVGSPSGSGIPSYTSLPSLNINFSLSNSTSSRGHKFFVIINNSPQDPDGGKLLELSAPCYKSKLQWMSAIQCAISHSHSQRSYQSYLASQRKIVRLEKRASEEARQREIEARIAQRVETEMVTPLRKEIALLEERVREETQAKRDEEIVRGAQSRLLVEEWEKMERLQKELEATKVELIKVKSETVRLARTQPQLRPQLHRARSWGDNIDLEVDIPEHKSRRTAIAPKIASTKDILRMDLNIKGTTQNGYDNLQ